MLLMEAVVLAEGGDGDKRDIYLVRVRIEWGSVW